MTKFHTILTMLEAGPMDFMDIMAKAGWTKSTTAHVLAQLRDRKDIKCISRGTYQLAP